MTGPIRWLSGLVGGCDRCAVTSNVERIFPFQVLLPADETGLRVDSKAQAEQVRSVAVERVGSAVGRVSPRVMAAVEEALRLHLQL
ncbi:type II toxin-antitoxin system PemK/MazF family toxin [Ruania zhangjianzhongii]|uniref:type II toxin-antitoxin system PemK/MazF family toxin n=1 Tax=Ruania zhangjianzhongii TaxID=2603206 RepID=UPI002467CECE|nr:type II toxin-antitoxin system PemK/MazF family toxin [Ruania zhangjianzhongii]